MDERRKFQRTQTSLRVEMHHPAFGTIVGFARDISDGGAQVNIDNHPLPPVGTVVQVLFKKMVGQINEEPVSMRVMHSGGSGVGLMFVH